ncbi:MAG: YitT family protein [Clostridium sp.]|nr:YitT family protein [Clostridium sp.]
MAIGISFCRIPSRFTVSGINGIPFSVIISIRTVLFQVQLCPVVYAWHIFILCYIVLSCRFTVKYYICTILILICLSIIRYNYV